MNRIIKHQVFTILRVDLRLSNISLPATISSSSESITLRFYLWLTEYSRFVLTNCETSGDLAFTVGFLNDWLDLTDLSDFSPCSRCSYLSFSFFSCLYNSRFLHLIENRFDSLIGLASEAFFELAAYLSWL